MSAAAATGLYLNVGAGNPAPGWVNLDASPHFRLPRAAHRILAGLGAARSRHFIDTEYRYYRFLPGRRLPFADGAAAAVYCSHVLEHLLAAGIPGLLAEFARLLRSGGALRIVVPDLEAVLRRALDGAETWVPLHQALGTLPPSLLGAPLRAALEGLAGFPSFHKTLLLPRQLVGSAGPDWSVRSGLARLESAIDRTLLDRVERQQLDDSVVVELVRR
jgi:SAM-dependent methyltransferase